MPKITEKKKEYYRQYYLKNKEKITARNKEWAKTHKEQIRVYFRKYYQKNKAVILSNKMKYSIKLGWLYHVTKGKCQDDIRTQQAQSKRAMRNFVSQYRRREKCIIGKR